MGYIKSAVQPAQTIQLSQSNPTGCVITVISVLCGIVGFLVAGIVLGLIAIVTGIVAISMSNRIGIAGLILGILDIVAVLLIYSGYL